MLAPVLILLMIATALSCAGCLVVLKLSGIRNLIDTQPMPGQTKMPARRIPNTGGIAIVWSILIPLIAAVALAHLSPSWMPDSIAAHFGGIREMTRPAIWFLAAILLLHALGLYDDRRPLGPIAKLLIMIAPAIIVVGPLDTRLLTLLDPHVGTWASILITVLWIVMITNAMNFIDNMDGYCAGVATIASTGFMVGALLQEQWFVAGCLALLAGSCIGFLLWNRPPAKLFMGDGGSLVVGFLLAFLTTRTTYAAPGATVDEFASGAWYALLMPPVVLAVPLYDFFTVTAVRLSQGKSPFVGDLQHFSHRLVNRGLSGRAAVGLILSLAAACAICGILLTTADPLQAILLAILLGVMFITIASLEALTSSASKDTPA